ncbi:MAG: DCC1-like thiol-disulfide oxidoreductase family protein [Cyanobacteriota bacterium]|nr:DCC1-like thiol-disulfide oxidoreductase family protein [Cyanobacteriota bacterium]
MPLTLVYDGSCPFCRLFALRTELAAGLPQLVLCDGRSDHALRAQLRQRGCNLARGAVLIEGDQLWHGAAAIAELCRRMQPSDALLSALRLLFVEPKRTRRLYPLLLLARRWALHCRGLSEDPDAPLSNPASSRQDFT